MREQVKNDKIFLLSVAEYWRLRENIPLINCWWWLRSPGSDSCSAVDVRDDGSVCLNGCNVHDGSGAVRPALKISNLESSKLEIGARFVAYDFPWIKISEDLAIAEVPISFRRFNQVSRDHNGVLEESNDYETSDIRRFLLDWGAERAGRSH